LFPLLLLWPFFFQGKVLFWGTPLTQFYPWRELAVEMLQAGQFPLWNHYVGSGAPLLANHQTAVFYPLFVLYLLFPTEQALVYEVAIHLALAGLFTYFYGRGIGLGRPGALVAGLSFMGSGFLISRLGFPSMVAAAAWLPLLFLLTHRLVRAPSPQRLAALGIVIGVQFLAGHAQLWYYSVWGIGLYAFYLGWRWGGIKGCVRSASLLAGAGLLGISLAAVQLLPTAEMALISQRRGGAEWEFAMTYSFWPWRFITLLVPDFFGNPAHGNYWGYANYWEDCGYIGVLPFILACWALLLWLKKEKARGFVLLPFFLALIPLSLLLALGKNTPVYPLIFRYVPGFGFFQAPSRFLYLYTFAMAVVAGIGMDSLRVRPFPAGAAERLLVGGLALCIGAVTAHILPLRIKETFALGLLRFAPLLIASAALLRFYPRLGRRRWWLFPFLVGVDLLLFGWGFTPAISPELYHLPTDTGRFFAAQKGPFRIYTFGPEEYHIKYERYFRFDDFGPEDVSYWKGMRESQIPQLNMFEKLEHARVFDPLMVGRYRRLLDIIDEAPLGEALKLLGMLNVRYILSARPIPGLEPVVQRGGYLIYENGRFLPRAYVVSRARRASDDEAALAMVASPDFDPAEEVIVSAGGALPTQGHSPPRYAIQRLQYLFNEVRIEIVVERPGYLVLSQTWYPGWQVYVDGKLAPLLRANYALMAVEVGQGSHSVVFCYRPLAFRAGAVISLTSLALVLLSVFVVNIRSKADGQCI